jgi:hypothetical protein
MSLTKKIKVSYIGDDNLLCTSPVFDVLNVPIPTPGKLAGQMGLGLSSFFLVFKNNRAKKLRWISIDDCDLVSVDD